jgi:hypothetical protein
MAITGQGVNLSSVPAVVRVNGTSLELTAPHTNSISAGATLTATPIIGWMGFGLSSGTALATATNLGNELGSANTTASTGDFVYNSGFTTNSSTVIAGNTVTIFGDLTNRIGAGQYVYLTGEAYGATIASVGATVPSGTPITLYNATWSRVVSANAPIYIGYQRPTATVTTGATTTITWTSTLTGIANGVTTVPIQEIGLYTYPMAGAYQGTDPASTAYNGRNLIAIQNVGPITFTQLTDQLQITWTITFS